MQIYKHFSEYTGEWPWKHFTPEEIACKHCGELVIDVPSLDALEELREDWGEPIVLNSGHRCEVHNLAENGKENSEHRKIAFDCRCAKAKQKAFIAKAKKAGFKGIGTYNTFIHLDMGRERAWVG